MNKLRFNYGLYPNVTQEKIFDQMMGNSRFVWNYYLAKEKQQYSTDKTFNFFKKNSRDLTDLKQEKPWLGESTRDSLTQTLKQLELAMQQSFKSKSDSKKKRKGFPKLKKKRFNMGTISGSTSSGLNLKHVDYDNNKIKLPKLGLMRIKWSRKLPGEIKSWTIKRKGGKYTISFVVEVPVQPPVTEVKSAVGLDFNSKDLVVTSDGEIKPNPKFYKKAKVRLRRVRRKRMHKTCGSNNYYKALQCEQRAYAYVANQRHNALHQISSEIVDRYDAICIEDLNVRAMQRFNGSMIQDAGFGALRCMLDYKAHLYGKHLIVIDRFAPSTQMCSNCNHVRTGDERLTLSDRVYTCTECGHEMDRDLNAAINIRQIGMGSAKLTPAEMTSGGDMSHDISSPASMNQECIVGVPTLSSNKLSE